MNKLSVIFLTVFLSSCVSYSPPPDSAPANFDIKGDKYWTLDFFHFYMGKQTHTERFQFSKRRDCFDTLYQMQVDSKKQIFHSGAGICTKLFVEGQKRTQDDVLGYR